MTHAGPRLLAAVLAAGAAACGGDARSTSPTPVAGTATVRFVYRAATAPRTDLPPSARACVEGVGQVTSQRRWPSGPRMANWLQNGHACPKGGSR